jgi:hypothetical protein
MQPSTLMRRIRSKLALLQLVWPVGVGLGRCHFLHASLPRDALREFCHYQRALAPGNAPPSFAAHVSGVQMKFSDSERLPMLQRANIEVRVAPAALLQRFFLHVATMVGRCHIVTAGRTGFVIRSVRNHLAESSAISRLGLDLDCSL